MKITQVDRNEMEAVDHWRIIIVTKSGEEFELIETSEDGRLRIDVSGRLEIRPIAHNAVILRQQKIMDS